MFIVLVVLIALAAIVLLGSGKGRMTSGWLRLVSYVCGILLIAFIAGSAAVSLDSCDSSQYECDLAGLGFVFVGGLSLIVGVAAAIVYEIWFRSRLRNRT